MYFCLFSVVIVAFCFCLQNKIAKALCFKIYFQFFKMTQLKTGRRIKSLNLGDKSKDMILVKYTGNVLKS
jgi:hypothetical protein